GLSFVSLGLVRSFDKYSLRRLLTQERAYARKFVAFATAERPELVVMCNVPLIAHALTKRKLIKHKIPTVFWHQDLYSHAIGLEARRRFGPIGALISRAAEHIEAWIARHADTVIAISDHFIPVHQRWGTEPGKLH